MGISWGGDLHCLQPLGLGLQMERDPVSFQGFPASGDYCVSFGSVVYFFHCYCFINGKLL